MTVAVDAYLLKLDYFVFKFSFKVDNFVMKYIATMFHLLFSVESDQKTCVFFRASVPLRKTFPSGEVIFPRHWLSYDLPVRCTRKRNAK